MLVALAAASVAGGSEAQAFPAGHVSIVPTAAPSTAEGALARDLALAMRRHLGANVAIDASHTGSTSIDFVAAAAADGRTLLFHHSGLALGPMLAGRPPLQIADKFEYVGLFAEAPLTLVGRPGLPASDIGELRDWFRANRGGVFIGYSQTGSASHSCAVLLQQALGEPMTAVAYKTVTSAMIDLIGGDIDLMCDHSVNTGLQVRFGNVKVFGIAAHGRLRSAGFRSVPTLAEAGLPGFVMRVAFGLYAPKGTPGKTLDSLSAALKAVSRDPDFARKVAGYGATMLDGSRRGPDGHRAFVEAETAKLAPLVRRALVGVE